MVLMEMTKKLIGRTSKTYKLRHDELFFSGRFQVGGVRLKETNLLQSSLETDCHGLWGKEGSLDVCRGIPQG
jgi:hypothetical protein